MRKLVGLFAGAAILVAACGGTSTTEELGDLMERIGGMLAILASDHAVPRQG